MPSSWFARALCGAAIVPAVASCSATDLTPLCVVPASATEQQRTAAVAACSAMGSTRIFDERLHQDVDILFVIANSPAMAPKQKALGTALAQFIRKIDATNINYHIGVITTDVGTETAADAPFPGAARSACSSYAGDDGVLQNIPCPDRSGLVGESAAACAASCPDSRFVPAYGARYIQKIDGITNVPPLIVDGVDRGPEQAFQCMALVGSTGCQVAQPLEAARRALDNHRSDNAHFNRESSVLAVIFISDQDDCSVPVGQRKLLDPATPDAGQPACETGSKTVDGQCFNAGFRCIAKDLACNEEMNTPGKKTGCKEDPNSFLTPIDEYVKFFASLPNPNVVIAGIWTPTLLDNLDSLPPPRLGGLYVDYDPAARNSAGLGPGTKSAAGCYNSDPSLTSDPQGFFGAAQLRLSSFIRRFNKSYVTEQSICDPASYSDVLSVITDSVNSWSPLSCLTQIPKAVQGVPQCIVGYVDAVQTSGTPDYALPVCSATCCNFFATDSDPWKANNPIWVTNPHRVAGAAACGAEPRDCYCAVPSAVNCTGGAVAGIWRQGNALPQPGKVISFSCAY